MCSATARGALTRRQCLFLLPGIAPSPAPVFFSCLTTNTLPVAPACALGVRGRNPVQVLVGPVAAALEGLGMASVRDLAKLRRCHERDIGRLVKKGAGIAFLSPFPPLPRRCTYAGCLEVAHVKERNRNFQWLSCVPGKGNGDGGGDGDGDGDEEEEDVECGAVLCGGYFTGPRLPERTKGNGALTAGLHALQGAPSSPPSSLVGVGTFGDLLALGFGAWLVSKFLNGAHALARMLVFAWVDACASGESSLSSYDT